MSCDRMPLLKEDVCYDLTTHSPRYIELDNPDTVVPDDDDLLPKVAGVELHHVVVAVGVHRRQREPRANKAWIQIL